MTASAIQGGHNKCSAAAEMSDHFAATDMGRKERAAVPLLRELGPHLTQYGLAWAAVYLRTNWHLAPSSRLGRIDMGRKVREGGCAPLGGGELGPHLTQCHLGLGHGVAIPSGILIHPAVWPQQSLSKNWGLCPFWGGGTGSPCNTM